jgi:hypothetical protein
MISVLYPMHRTKKQRTAGKKKAADMHGKCRKQKTALQMKDMDAILWPKNRLGQIKIISRQGCQGSFFKVIELASSN